MSGSNRYTLLAPGEGDPADGGKWKFRPLPPAFPDEKDTAVSGIPRSDGRRVAFTNRIKRRAALYDFEDAQHPRLVGAWKLSGNPDLARLVNLYYKMRIPFYNGPIDCRLFIYEGCELKGQNVNGNE